MAGFTADAALAAMAQRSAEILKNSGQAALPAGGFTSVQQQAQIPQIPTSFLANRVDQLQGIARMSAQMVAALKQGSGYLPNNPQALQLQQMQVADASGQNSIDDFTRGFLGNTGWTGSDEAFRALAQSYAPSYGGQTFAAHNIAQEGQVSYRNGQPGVMIKYTSPGQGSDTVWVPVAQQQQAPQQPAGQYWW